MPTTIIIISTRVGIKHTYIVHVCAAKNELDKRDVQGARALKARAYLLLTKAKNVGLGFDMAGQMKLSRNTRFLLHCLQDRGSQVLVLRRFCAYSEHANAHARRAAPPHLASLYSLKKISPPTAPFTGFLI